MSEATTAPAADEDDGATEQAINWGGMIKGALIVTAAVLVTVAAGIVLSHAVGYLLMHYGWAAGLAHGAAAVGTAAGNLLSASAGTVLGGITSVTSWIGSELGISQFFVPMATKAAAVTATSYANTAGVLGGGAVALATIPTMAKALAATDFFHTVPVDPVVSQAHASIPPAPPPPVYQNPPPQVIYTQPPPVVVPAPAPHPIISPPPVFADAAQVADVGHHSVAATQSADMAHHGITEHLNSSATLSKVGHHAGEAQEDRRPAPATAAIPAAAIAQPVAPPATSAMANNNPNSTYAALNQANQANARWMTEQPKKSSWSDYVGGSRPASYSITPRNASYTEQTQIDAANPALSKPVR